MTRRTITVVVALTVALVAVGGCGGGGPSHGVREQAIAPLLHSSDVGPLPVAPEALVQQLASARGLRLGLRSLLAQHTLLVGEVLERGAAGSPDLRTASKALAENTTNLVAAIGVVYGPAGARAFKELWAQHAQFLVQYALAPDGAGRRAAKASLTQYHHDFSLFCNLATGLPALAVDALVGDHLDALLARADASAAGDASAALAATLRGLSQVGSIADALAGAISRQHPDTFPGQADDAFTDLAADLGDELTAQEVVAVDVASHAGEPELGARRAGLPAAAVRDAGLRAALARLDGRLRVLATRGAGQPAIDAAATATADDLEAWARRAGASSYTTAGLRLLVGAEVQAVGRRIAAAARPTSQYLPPAGAAPGLAAALAAIAVPDPA